MNKGDKISACKRPGRTLESIFDVEKMKENIKNVDSDDSLKRVEYYSAKRDSESRIDNSSLSSIDFSI